MKISPELRGEQQPATDSTSATIEVLHYQVSYDDKLSM